MEEKKKKIFSGQVPTAIFYILFGLCLALMPVETVNVLCKVIFGLVLIGAGVYHIVIFVLEKDNSTMLDLFSGVIVLVIGIFLFMNPTVVVKLLTLMLGAFILVDSIWMLRGSLKLMKRKQGVWKAFLVESLTFIGLGVLILVNPFSGIKMAVQVSGCIFVANGVLDIIFYFLLKHGLKKEIETDGENEKKEEKKSQTEESTEMDSAAYEQNHGNAEARFGAENTLGKALKVQQKQWMEVILREKVQMLLRMKLHLRVRMSRKQMRVLTLSVKNQRKKFWRSGRIETRYHNLRFFRNLSGRRLL